MRIFVLVLFLGISFQVAALEKCMSGAWFDPERNGEGMVLEILDEQTLGYFYTYGSEGRAWYVMLGEDALPDVELLTIYGTAKVSNIPFVVREFDVGSAFISVIDNDSIRFKYDLVLDVDRDAAIPWCLAGFCEGDYTYQRLSQPIPCE